MDNLYKIYQFNQSIEQLRKEMIHMIYTDSQRSVDFDSVILIKINRIQGKYNNLTRERNRKIKSAYTGTIVRSKEIPRKLEQIVNLLALPKMKVTTMLIGKDSTKLDMTPKWFHLDDEAKIVKTIKYPPNVTNKRSFNTVARFRSVKTESNDSNDFISKPIEVQQAATETLVLALDAFADQFNSKSSFTNEDLSFEESAHRTACGIADLGSAHLLVNEHIPSAQFTLVITIDYDDLAQSEETMGNFTSAFASAVATDLACDNDYVRVSAVKKSTKGRGNVDVNLVLTTPDKSKTEELAAQFQDHARLGFAEDTILCVIKRDVYNCKWMPILSFLQLKPQDFALEHNFDYTQPNLPETQRRGNVPYYLPIGWYRHALKVDNKYRDDPAWLGSSNGPNEWPVAFHGTNSNAVRGITDQGLLLSKVKNDFKRKDAAALKGSDADQPGLYVATHCNGGSHPQYTARFNVNTSNGVVETFQVVFQCRIRPNSYTEHTSPVQTGHAWRTVDPTAIRPYGILLKSINIKVPFEDNKN